MVTNASTPNFDVINNGGLEVVTDDVFTNHTVIDNGFGLISVNDAVTPVPSPNIDLGTYRVRWSGQDANGESIVNGQLSPPATVLPPRRTGSRETEGTPLTRWPTR